MFKDNWKDFFSETGLIYNVKCSSRVRPRHY